MTHQVQWMIYEPTKKPKPTFIYQIPHSSVPCIQIPSDNQTWQWNNLFPLIVDFQAISLHEQTFYWMVIFHQWLIARCAIKYPVVSPWNPLKHHEIPWCTSPWNPLKSPFLLGEISWRQDRLAPSRRAADVAWQSSCQRSRSSHASGFASWRQRCTEKKQWLIMVNDSY